MGYTKGFNFLESNEMFYHCPYIAVGFLLIFLLA